MWLNIRTRFWIVNRSVECFLPSERAFWRGAKGLTRRPSDHAGVATNGVDRADHEQQPSDQEQCDADPRKGENRKVVVEARRVRETSNARRPGEVQPPRQLRPA